MNNLKHRIKIVRIVFPFIVLMLFLFGCSPDENKPYEPDTPAPSAHDGRFVSDHGTMSFDGNGEKVTIDFDEYLSGLLGLPEGKQDADYSFLSGDLPPVGSVPVRYDTAHELQITIGDKKAVIDMGIASEDGKTAQKGVNMVTPDKIPMLFYQDGVSFNITFLKESK